MDSRRHIRPLVALVAAYAIALQALLAGMALGVRSGQATLLAANSLCLTDTSRPDHAPSEPMPCCVNGLSCPMGAAPGTLPQSVEFVPHSTEAPALFAAHIDRAGILAPEGLKQPRAPPAV